MKLILFVLIRGEIQGAPKYYTPGDVPKSIFNCLVYAGCLYVCVYFILFLLAGDKFD
jgi:hypothetical protein